MGNNIPKPVSHQNVATPAAVIQKTEVARYNIFLASP